MNNKEAKKLIRETFRIVKKAKKVSEINNFIMNHKLLKQKYKDENDYPSLRFNISKKEIKYLVNSKLLSKDFYLSNEIAYKKSTDTLTKILYSVVWKRQDLKKIRNIIQGILGKKNEGNSVVFYQFGKHLNKPSSEPIIDQNVIRAFLLYKSINKKEKIFKELRKKNTVNDKDKVTIDKYKKWIIKSVPKNQKTKNGIETIDKLLFILGQLVKVNS